MKQELDILLLAYGIVVVLILFVIAYFKVSQWVIHSIVAELKPKPTEQKKKASIQDYIIRRDVDYTFDVALPHMRHTGAKFRRRAWEDQSAYIRMSKVDQGDEVRIYYYTDKGFCGWGAAQENLLATDWQYLGT